MFDGVASWSSLGPFALLLRVDFDQLTQDLPFPGVGDLLGDPEHAVLVRSAEEFLDRAGDSGSTAQALHVHRTTLYHRLKRVETITACPWTTGWTA
ncbi:helix-turn-helix domain-containing protein [Streptomyces sp. NPDC050548]|uniref:helix-turn-helix domain-containing protein n=1 Tax=Streptomyces sp. NPDC050548 TaxID=3365629 RepID=UPI0037BBC869